MRDIVTARSTSPAARRPGAVLFDCDGVLVDSEPFAHRIVAEDLAARGLQVDAGEFERRFTGSTMAERRKVVEAAGITLPATWAEDVYAKLYQELARGVPLIPGVIAVLDRLEAAGIPTAVGSNGQLRKMAITLGQHPELAAHFGDRVFSGQDLGKPKPDPALYLHAAAMLGVAPYACVVIDDSRYGCIAGLRAGMRTLGFAPHDDGAELAALGAEVFHRMVELPPLLGL